MSEKNYKQVFKKVVVKGNNFSHIVTLFCNGEYSCNCDHFKYRGKLWGDCSHILFVKENGQVEKKA